MKVGRQHYIYAPFSRRNDGIFKTLGSSSVFLEWSGSSLQIVNNKNAFQYDAYPLTVSHQKNHAPPPEQPDIPPLGATMHAPPPEQPCMPPRSNHARPPEQPRMPPQEQPCTPPREQPRMPPLRATRMPPPVDRQTPVKT